MEAAAARAAARDRWGEMTGYSAPSQLQRFIASACSPENYEPNLALCLEIADLINSKKGSAPREASVAIVGYINHRNTNVALLALNLLDICVKNCGYPFHLQISTKEFLNELVRRFPERPSPRPTRVQSKILEAIEEWRSTICDTSRYKEDLGFIRDMHRLLSYKGYMFPEVRRDDAAVLNPSDNLKSADEMEQEEHEAQSAKLHELIRRGSPEDLQEANRLMKIMAGYDTRDKTDYRAKAAEDVAKIQAKARLLEERLEAFKASDRMTEGDVFEELANALSSAQPKIQKMCEEESEDHEAVAKLLEINDSIHRTVERWKLLKKGDMEGAARIARGVFPATATASTAASSFSATPGAQQAELSLIDFDADAEAEAEAPASNGQPQATTSTTTTGTNPTSLESDLLGLELGDAGTFGQGGGIALGFGNNTNMPGPALLSSVSHQSTAGVSSTTSPPPGMFSSFASAAPLSQSQSPAQLQTKSPPPSFTKANSNPNPDPFAALASPPFRSQTSTPTPKTPSMQNQIKSNTNTTDDDEEWSFSSALPGDNTDKGKGRLPREHAATVMQGPPLRIEMKALRGMGAAGNALALSFAFTNLDAGRGVDGVHFEVAVTKGYELQLQPQTGRELAPGQRHGITQAMLVWHSGDRGRRVGSVKLRFRIGYRFGGESRNEMGEVAEFGIA